MIARCLIGVFAGAVLGLACYKFVGCTGGTCPLTGNPWLATAYGGLLGALVAASVK
jgi:hypothetical protein